MGDLVKRLGACFVKRPLRLGLPVLGMLTLSAMIQRLIPVFARFESVTDASPQWLRNWRWQFRKDGDIRPLWAIIPHFFSIFTNLMPLEARHWIIPMGNL